MEVTARGRIDWARHVALQDNALRDRRGLWHGNRRKQGLRIGMLWTGKERTLVGQLDDAAQVHDRDTVGNMLHDRQIMGNKDVGQAEILLQIGKQVDDLRLYGDVQGRYRLVAHDHVRLQGQRARNHQALSLSAREFVGETHHLVSPQSDLFEKLGNPRRDLRPCPALEVAQRLGDNVLGAHAWIERGVGILEYHLQAVAALPHGATAEAVDAFTVEVDLAGRWLDQLQDHFAGRRFPATRFADETQGFARSERKRDAVDGVDRADLAAEKPAPHGKVFFEVAHLEHGCGSAAHAGSSVSRSASQQATQWPSDFASSGG